MTGVQVSDDGTLIARGDVMPAHFRAPNGSEWIPLVRPGENTPAIDYQNNAFARGPGGGSFACAIHPTNSDIMASFEDGQIWLTTDGSQTIALTNYPQNSVSNSNHGNGRLNGGARMAFDPASSAGQILAVVDNVGLQYTTDGGATWIQHPDIPAPGDLRRFGVVQFDRSSAVVGGKTQVVYVFVYDSGVWRSTTGITGTFTLISGSPTVCQQFVCDGGGKIHILGDNESPTQYFQWTSGGGWVAPDGITGKAVAVNPANVNQMFMKSQDGWRYSGDNGVSWTAANNKSSQSGNEVVWRITTRWLGSVPTAVVWVPGTNRIVCCDGFGMFYVENMPTDGVSPYKMYEFSLGLDLVIPMSIDVLPNDRVVIVAQDHHWFHTTPDTAHLPFHHSDGLEWRRKLAPPGFTSPPNGNAGGMDWFASDPDCWGVASTFNFGGGANPAALFLTQDNGESFQLVPPPTGLVIGNGNIAFGFDGAKYIAIWLPTNKQYPRYVTVDAISDLPNVAQGDWQPLLLDPTYTTTFGAGWHQANYIARRCLVSDKNNDGTFYIFNDGNGLGDAADLAMRGLWRITFSGGVPTATRVMNGYFTLYIYDFWHGKFRLNPQNSAHQFWCTGDSSPTNMPIGGKQIQFSSNDWVTKAPVGDLTEVYDFAFGKAAPGKSYPTIYAEGWKTNPDVFGLYWCRDFNPASPATATWELISQFPHGTHHQITVMAADMNRFGRVYMGLGSEGGLIMDYGKTFTLG